MAGPKPLDPRASLAAMLGARVRKLRQGKEWTQQQLADASFVSHTRIAQVELATDPPNEALAQQIDDALAADGEITDLWWHPTPPRT
ncbi:helix-turn-helix domain-containing protein [Streptomyces millisiae]|uniref:Helix-turn-helix transcriptional regulator n=1 Tax=Streptomyces millisiae TaxID=3075542 RepID=A0ABU2LY95_9ACTN|nr:helix-turn-helix transcriptional regulator [Streptomyces sp. DSM 44918]MDT0322571.1 helix-turn-helix transcriptional regulator [Streptomyces sp. DSM 44918]